MLIIIWSRIVFGTLKKSKVVTLKRNNFPKDDTKLKYKQIKKKSNMLKRILLTQNWILNNYTKSLWNLVNKYQYLEKSTVWSLTVKKTDDSIKIAESFNNHFINVTKDLNSKPSFDSNIVKVRRRIYSSALDRNGNL